MMKVLLLLPQSPFEQAAGDGRSMRTICEMLVTQGFSVSALAPTASYGKRNQAEGLLRMGGVSGVRVEVPSCPADRPVMRFAFRGIDYTLLDVGEATPGEWERTCGGQLESLFQQKLNEGFDILFTYGGSPADVARRKLVREHGGKVVFGLRGFGYLNPGMLEHIDAFVPCSAFVADRYRRELELQMQVLPLPIWADDVVAPNHRPEYLTFINPTHAKGVMLFARLAEMLAKGRPEMPIRVVESRGTGNDLLAAGFAGGFDLRKHPNLKVIPNTGNPRTIYARTRVLVVPSVWDEPAGRVPVEAMLNGIPPIVSDRGGLPEVCRGGGFVIPMPDHIRPFPPDPVSAQDAQPWFDLVARLWDDQAFYEAACQRAREAARFYETKAVAGQYGEFFSDVGGV